MTSARRADWSRIPINRDEQDEAVQVPFEQDEVVQGPLGQDEAEQGPVDVADVDPDVEHAAFARGAGPGAGLDAETVEVPVEPDREGQAAQGQAVRDQAVRDQAVRDQAVQDSPGPHRSGPDDPDALRARVQSLRSRVRLDSAGGPAAHSPGRSQVQEADADAARRVQLAVWAEDDARHQSGVAFGDRRDASDEDGS